MDIKVLIQALNKPWLIEPAAAQLYAVRVAELLQSGKWDADDKENKMKEFAWVVNVSGKNIGTIADAKENGVAVINMQGAVMKYDYCGTPGTQTLIKSIQQANDNPAINGIVLQIDSPGGSVDGTEQMANAIKQSKKPVVAYVNGMMASAAMWIGSSTKSIIASSSTDVIGSIGTMVSFRDYTGMYEQSGIKSHDIYATDSTDKNSEYREALKGNYENVRSQMLDPINNSFIGAIKTNRPGIDASVLNGATYTAPTAKKKGLIDSIGTFSNAVNKALQLGKQQKEQQMNMQNEFKRILALVPSGEHFTADAVVNEGIYLTATHMAAIEAALGIVATRETELATANQLLTAAQASVTTAETRATTAEGTIATLNAEIVTLKKTPATGFSNTPKNGADNMPGAGRQAPKLTSVDHEKRRMNAENK